MGAFLRRCVVFCALIFWCFTLRICVRTSELHVRDTSRYVSQEKNLCNISFKTLTCDDIPSVIPQHITKVVVRHHKGDLPQQAFMDNSWTKIEILHFTGTDLSDINDDQFAKLVSLTELVLNLPDARRFKHLSLVGLDKLRRLDVVETHDLDFSSLETAFVTPRTLPNLEEFTFNPGEHLNAPLVVFSHNFTRALLHKPLRSLNVSNTIIEGEVFTGIKLLLKLDILNASGAIVIPSFRNDWKNSKLKQPVLKRRPNIEEVYLFHNTDFSTRPFFQTLDISRIKLKPGQTDRLNGRGSQTLYTPFPGEIIKHFALWVFNIVNLYANNVQHSEAELCTSFDLRNTTVFLKRIFARKNNIVKINRTLLFNKSNQIELVDASQNKIEYINPGFLSTVTNLRYLYFAHNQLDKMQNHPELSQLLKPLEKLQVFDVSDNSLSYLPWNVFRNNINIRTLNLAFNRFETIMFDLSSLVKLEKLDLSNNVIHSMDGTFLDQLESYVHLRQTGAQTDSLLIDFEGNPLKCTCTSLLFVKLLAPLRDLKNYVYVKTSRCIYESTRIEIDQGAVNRCQYLCHRTIIIVATVVSAAVSVVVVLLSIIIVKKVRRRRKQLTKEYQFRREFLCGETQQSHMVFLAYSSIDEDVVHAAVLDGLKLELQKRLDTDKNVVHTGNDFRPGHSIAVETFRLVELSCVFVAVVSESFCRSVYCRAEVQEACNQHKPIILILIGQVNEDDMSPYLREVFRRNSRAKLVQNTEGVFEFVPSLDTICDAIVQLAIEYRDI